VQSSRATASSRGIIVKWAGQSQEVGQIPPRGSGTAVFSIEAPKDLKAGTYPLSIHLDFDGEDRMNGSSDFTFHVPVKPKADFIAGNLSSGLVPGEKRVVSLNLTNTSTQEADKMQVHIRRFSRSARTARCAMWNPSSPVNPSALTIC